jgi:hypothetical protein
MQIEVPNHASAKREPREVWSAVWPWGAAHRTTAGEWGDENDYLLGFKEGFRWRIQKR